MASTSKLTFSFNGIILHRSHSSTSSIIQSDTSIDDLAKCFDSSLSLQPSGNEEAGNQQIQRNPAGPRWINRRQHDERGDVVMYDWNQQNVAVVDKTVRKPVERANVKRYSRSGNPLVGQGTQHLERNPGRSARESHPRRRTKRRVRTEHAHDDYTETWSTRGHKKKTIRRQTVHEEYSESYAETRKSSHKRRKPTGKQGPSRGDDLNRSHRRSKKYATKTKLNLVEWPEKSAKRSHAQRVLPQAYTREDVPFRLKIPIESKSKGGPVSVLGQLGHELKSIKPTVTLGNRTLTAQEIAVVGTIQELTVRYV
ncbi:hypothetical protein AB5N19_10569 [Seiridium cardinale]